MLVWYQEQVELREQESPQQGVGITKGLKEGQEEAEEVPVWYLAQVELRGRSILSRGAGSLANGLKVGAGGGGGGAGVISGTGGASGVGVSSAGVQGH